MRGRPTIFFVTGAQRSGTTWLVEMLHAHPEVNALGESWLVGGPADVDSWLNLDRLADWHALPMGRETWKHNLSLDQLRRIVLRGMVEAILLRGRPTHAAVGDKTPLGFLRRPDLLHDLFPDAKVIVMTRDGRDVAVSQQFRALAENKLGFYDSPEAGARAAAYHLRGEGEPCPLLTEPALRHYARVWRECIHGTRRARELWGDSLLELRYESLLANPAIVRDALRLLGVAADDAAVRRCVEAGDFARKTGRGRGTADQSSRSRKGIAGDWRRHFGERESRIYAEVAGRELAELGYDPA